MQAAAVRKPRRRPPPPKRAAGGANDIYHTNGAAANDAPAGFNATAKFNGQTDLARLHCRWLQMEWQRQLANRLQRRQWEIAYERGTSMEDIVGDNDWLAGVKINRLRGDIDMIIGEFTKRRPMPRITYAGDHSQKEFHRAAEFREMQSRGILGTSDFFAARETAIKDAILTGDGWVFYGVRKCRQTGRHKVEAQHIRWDSVLYDSLNMQANGNIDKCRFVARFSLMELDRVKAQFPNHAAEADELSGGLPTDRQTPLEDLSFEQLYSGRQTPYDERALVGGELSGRKFVVYGIMYYRDADGQIRKYPFLCNRSLTKMYQLAKETWPYSHNMYPFLHWVDGVENGGAVFSKMAEGRIGLEKVMNFGLRKLLRVMGRTIVVWSKDAVPTFGDGVKEQDLQEFKVGLMREADSDIPMFYTDRMDAIRIENPNAEVEQIARSMEFMLQGFNSSGASVHPSLTGRTGGSTPTAGVALRQHMDHALASYYSLFSCDQAQIVKVGWMNIYNMREFSDLRRARAQVSEQGDILPFDPSGLADKNGYGDVDIGAIEAGDLLVSVTPYQPNGTMEQHEAALLGETMKMYAGTSPELSESISLGALEKSGVGAATLRMVAKYLAGKGINVDEKYLDQEGKEALAAAKQRNAERAEKAEKLQEAAAAADIAEKQSKADKNAADATLSLTKATAEGAEPAAAGGGSAAKPAAGGKGGAPATGPTPGEAMAAAENYGLKQQMAQMAEQLQQNQQMLAQIAAAVQGGGR